MNDKTELDLFRMLSSVLTGYDLTDAQDGGADDPWRKALAEAYLGKLAADGEGGPQAVERMLVTFQECQTEAGGDPADLKRLVGERIVADDGETSKLARRAMRLWYLGAWFRDEPPDIGAWPNIYPAGSAFLSPEAYYRALAYPAGESHAPGNNLFDPVYGSWSKPPEAGIGPPTWPDGGDAADSGTS